MHKTKYSGDYESFVKIRDASDGWQLIKKHWRGKRIHANATLSYLSVTQMFFLKIPLCLKH